MEYNLITNIESCHIQLPHLLYYSHLPSIIVSLFFGIFVYFKSGRSLLGKLLLLISLTFSIWTVFNLITWVTFDGRIYSFSWSFFEVLAVMLYFFTLYFTYVFIEGKDISFKTKLFFSVLVLPVIVAFPWYYTTGIDVAECNAIMNDNFLYYVYALKIAVSLGMIFLLLSKYIKYRRGKIKKDKVALVGIGSLFFLLSFGSTQYLTDFILNNYYDPEFYGILAMNVFIGFLAFLIVRYKAFNIKLIGAQALVAAQFILIASIFTFATSTVNRILVAITLVLTSGAGWFLIQSVKKEVKRKEELQRLSDNLAAANERLRQLDIEKSEFISIASHQLRTPLTAIKGYISLILEGSYGAVTASIQDVLEKVYSVNSRLVHLVEDLLNVSRIEAGRIQYNFEPTQLEPLIAELVDMFTPTAKNKNLTLKMRLPKVPLPKLTVDPNKIKEVVSNLIDNSLKYTKEGGTTVTLESAGDKARITISDTGIGIKPEDIGKLFEKFVRTKETTKMVSSGTGLGLFVGRNFVEAHGGKIWAESEGADKGSRFIIELPLVNPKIHIGTSDQAGIGARDASGSVMNVSETE